MGSATSPAPAADILWQAADELIEQVRLGKGTDCLSATGALQAWHRTTGRFAEGRFSAVSVQHGTATALRFARTHGFHHLSRSGINPRAVARGDSAPAAPARHSLGLGWMEMSAVRTVLAEVDTAARRVDPAVAQVVIDFDLGAQDLLLADDEGAAAENRLLSYLTIRVIARRGGRMATGFYTPGLSGELPGIDPVSSGVEAGRRAVAGLDARPAPVGRMPVIVSGGRGIVMLHEACCHPLEGDEVLRGSVYADRLGEAVASPLVTITDDPTVPSAVGSYGRDDEGVPASSTTLIRDGQLTGYLTDHDSAARLGRESSGNGRCGTVLQPPLPRMSNTCLAPGASSVADIVADTKFGIYAQHVGGGEVIESTGEFTFRVTNGALIQNGRITDPVEETTISGTGTAVLADIDAVGDDPATGAAKCGKFGQWVPVGVVGPTLRVRSLLVGGTGR